MNIQCFSVFDNAAKAFITPFFLPQEGVAIRTFGDCVNDSGHQFGRHPQDYTLFRVGEFDSNTGRFTACEPVAVVSATQLRMRSSGNGELHLEGASNEDA